MDPLNLSKSNIGYLHPIENSRVKVEKNLNCTDSDKSCDDDHFLESGEKWNKFNDSERICRKNKSSKKVSDSLVSPYKMICKLLITNVYGSVSVGTGFFISPKCIITSGHIVYPKIKIDKREWAKKITVIPGDYSNIRPLGGQDSCNFRSVVGYIKHGSKKYDYGAIILDDCTLFKKVNSYFEYQILSNQSTLQNSGYGNARRSSGRQAKFSGKHKGKRDSFRLKYKFDTRKGNSGSPLFLSKKKEIAVGVHRGDSRPKCMKECILVTDEVIKRWNEWTHL